MLTSSSKKRTRLVMLWSTEARCRSVMRYFCTFVLMLMGNIQIHIKRHVIHLLLLLLLLFLLYLFSANINLLDEVPLFG